MRKSTGIRLIGISGSLRRQSNSSAILSTLTREISAESDMEIADIGALPLYNQDLDEGDGPCPVSNFRRAIEASDGVVIVSPEYNHGIPGVLKNAIDWASRPSERCALGGLPVLVITSAGSLLGGVRAQAQIHEALLAIGCRLTPGKQVVIGGADNKIEDGVLIHTPTIHFAVDRIRDLLREIRLLRAEAECEFVLADA